MPKHHANIAIVHVHAVLALRISLLSIRIRDPAAREGFVDVESLSGTLLDQVPRLLLLAHTFHCPRQSIGSLIATRLRIFISL